MISGYVSHEHKFASWYLDNHQAYKNNRTRMFVKQLGEVSDHDEMQAIFQRALLHLKAHTPSETSLGIIYVDYGYSYAAVEGKNGLTFVSRQSSFNEIEYWKYDVSEQLGYSDEDADIDPLDLFVQWIDDPRDRLELFHDVYRKILKRIVTETLDRLGESDDKTLMIMLPSLPRRISADWERLLTSITKEKCQIIIDNHGAGMELQQGTTLFLYHNYHFDAMETTLVEAFTQEQDGRIHADSYFYDKEYESDPRELLMVARMVTQGKIRKNVLSPGNLEKKQGTHTVRLPVRLGNVAGLTAFLRSHPAAFRDSLFVPVVNKDILSPRIEEIISFFGPHESLSVAYVCAQLCGDTELANISLMDMASTCSWLENKRFFQKTNLITHKKRIIFGVIDELPLDMDAIPYIPSNYSSIGWMCTAAPEAIPDYRLLNRESIDIANIIPALQSIVAHYDYCTTEDIASDLYYILKNGQEEPSALLTAKVYLILAHNSSFKASKTSEIVQKPIIDTEAYRASIPMLQRKRMPPMQRPNPSVQPITSQRIDASSKGISIAQMGLSVRTYNCLNRAGLRNADVICSKTDEELLKVRNLGMNGVKEIRSWQASRSNIPSSPLTRPNTKMVPAKAIEPGIVTKNPVHNLSPTTPATLERLPKKVHSKSFGSGTIVELISAKSGTKITILFDNGVKKTFVERVALQSGTIKYEY